MVGGWQTRRKPGAGSRESEIGDSLLYQKLPVADGAAELPADHRSLIHHIGDENQELFFVVRRAAEMVGQLDEHATARSAEFHPRQLARFDHDGPVDPAPVNFDTQGVLARRHVSDSKILLV